jgi:hypothetical protein
MMRIGELLNEQLKGILDTFMPYLDSSFLTKRIRGEGGGFQSGKEKIESYTTKEITAKDGTTWEISPFGIKKKG